MFLPKRSVKPEDLNRLALICFGGLGDVLLFSPVIAELKAWLPHVHLTLFTEARSQSAAELLEGVQAVQPIPTEILASKQRLFFYLSGELKHRHYDAVLCTGSSPFMPLMLAYSGVTYRVGYAGSPFTSWLLSQKAPLGPQPIYASELHLGLARAFLSPLLKEGKTPICQPKLQKVLPQVKMPSSQDKEAMAALLQRPILSQQSGKKHYLIHPGVSQAGLVKGINKTWPISYWADLILQLSREHYVYLIGGKDDADTIAGITNALPHRLDFFKNLTGETKSIKHLAALMSLMDAIICVDSAPLHLSVGLGKPTVVIFGPTDPLKLVPQGLPWVKAVYREDLACRPCLWAVRQSNCEASTCLQVPVTQVIQALQALP